MHKVNPKDRKLKVPEKQLYWYLATPYTKYPLGLEQAYKDACAVAGFLLKHGWNVFCPIAHSHPIAEHGNVGHCDHDFWMRVDRPMMDHACGLMVCEMPGWRESTGVNIEIATFTAAGKPIWYLRWPLLRPGSAGRTPELHSNPLGAAA